MAVLTGTLQADTLRGQAGFDYVYGLAGNDLISGWTPQIFGRWDPFDPGNELVGGGGNDRLEAARFDILWGDDATNRFIFDSSWTGAEHGVEPWYIGDFDGDGKDDIFSYQPGISGAYVQLSTGSSFGSQTSWTGAGHGVEPWYVGDFDGDGKDDIFSYQPGISGAYVQLSTGNSFGSQTSWTGAGHGIEPWYVGDFDGDGKDDIFSYQPGISGAYVQLSTGSSFGSQTSWTGAGHGVEPWYVGDFDGDGKDDLLRYVPGVSGAEVFLSNGSSFEFAGSWTAAGSGIAGWRVADFNSDGKDDLLRDTGGQTEVLLSTGSSFAELKLWLGGSSGSEPWYVGNFDGSGGADIFKYQPGDSGAAMYLEHSPVISGPTGPAGSDTFVFGRFIFNSIPLTDMQGARIMDFIPSGPTHDVIEFHQLFTDFSDLMANTEQVGSDAVITYHLIDLGHDLPQRLVLENTNVFDLIRDDFLFLQKPIGIF